MIIREILDKYVFVSREALRNLRLNLSESCRYLILTVINLIIISLIVMVIFNFNYLREAFSSNLLTDSSYGSILPTVLWINKFKYIFYIILTISVIGLFYVNSSYLTEFLSRYRKERELIKKINGDRKLSKLPLVFTATFINGISIILAWFASYFIYQYLYRLLVLKYLKYSLLYFAHFKVTLFSFLLITGLGTGNAVCYYLFWSTDRPSSEG